MAVWKSQGSYGEGLIAGPDLPKEVCLWSRHLLRKSLASLQVPDGATWHPQPQPRQDREGRGSSAFHGMIHEKG